MTDDPLLPAATALRAITDLSASLLAQAVARATHHDLPGGDAMVALGPVASPEACGWVVDSIENGRWQKRDYSDELAHNDDVSEPPLQTLRFWSEQWRFEHGQVNDKPTIATEAAWLAGVLQWAYEHEPHWADFERDLRVAVARLEALLYAGERDERTRVPCPYCQQDRAGEAIRVRLIRFVDPVSKPGSSDQRGGLNDDWNCPRCERRFDEKGYNLARHQALIDAQEIATRTTAM